jgi:hypothetical protein
VDARTARSCSGDVQPDRAPPGRLRTQVLNDSLTNSVEGVWILDVTVDDQGIVGAPRPWSGPFGDGAVGGDRPGLAEVGVVGSPLGDGHEAGIDHLVLVEDNTDFVLGAGV